jgi:endonuclease YncB( thermonuclease family)
MLYQLCSSTSLPEVDEPGMLRSRRSGMGDIVNFRRRARGPWDKPPRPRSSHWQVWLAGLVVGFVLTLLVWLSLGPQRAPLPEVTPLGGSTSADVMTSISVVDGDTVRSGGRTYRLVGFDTPERGDLARCARERALAQQATLRLQQLVGSGDVTLQRVACACKAGTEGTSRCNYGRLCGTLRADGQDVGTVLIHEGLAHPYVCSGTGCPRRRSWCG